MKRIFFGLVLCSFITLIACSDDGTTARDSRMPDILDASVDILVSDGLSDQTLDISDLQVQDNGVDSIDASTDIGAKDIFSPDVLNWGLHGTVTMKVNPSLDGKGDLYVLIYGMLMPPMPPQTYQIFQADFSKVGNTFHYVLPSKPKAGTYTMMVFLDDNDNVTTPFFVADGGDVTSAMRQITVDGTTDPQKEDFELTELVGANDVGFARGNITSTQTPSGDGVGNVYVHLYDTWPVAPGTAPLAGTVVSSADLSSPYAKTSYYLGNLAAGKYYLYAFLDDNDNAGGLFVVPEPDAGDMVMSTATQIRIEVGKESPADLTLDALKQ